MTLKQSDINRRKALARKLIQLAHDLLSTDEMKPGQKAWTCSELEELWDELNCGIDDFNPQLKSRPPVPRSL